MERPTFWGAEKERALDKEKPQANAQPVAVKVDLNLANTGWGAEGLGNGIRSLQQQGARCDVDLEVGGEVFSAHQIMIASMSKAFRTFLQHLKVNGDSVESTDETMSGILSIAQPPAPPPAEDAAAAAASAPPAEAESVPLAAAEAQAPAAEVPATEAAASGAEVDGGSAKAAAVQPSAPQRLKLVIGGISRPESVRILLNYVYQVGTGMPWEYKPSCVEVDKDVLHLARSFELDHLHEYAARWLIDGLSTLNVVERLVVCEEFQLGNLREKMMEQLAAVPDALGIVCSNPDIMKHPKIMQDLLKSVAFGKSAKAPEKKAEEKAPEKPDRVEKAEKAEKADKAEKSENPEKAEKPVKAEKAEKAEKLEKSDNSEKADKPVKAEKATEKQERPSAEKPPPAKKARKAGGA